MIIIVWALCFLIFITVSVIVIQNLLVNPHYRTSFETFRDGFLRGLRFSGLEVKKKRLTVELYRWEALHDEHVCADCLERSQWPPMDIADWMKVGMPGTPEAKTECAQGCRCKLVRSSPTFQFDPKAKDDPGAD